MNDNPLREAIIGALRQIDPTARNRHTDAVMADGMDDGACDSGVCFT